MLLSKWKTALVAGMLLAGLASSRSMAAEKSAAELSPAEFKELKSILDLKK